MLEIIISFFFVVVSLNWYITMYGIVGWVLYMLLNIFIGGEYLLKVLMVMLSLWIILMMMMSVEMFFMKLDLYLIIMLMYLSLYICFFSESLMSFYLGFEMSVIPILLILFGWGYQPDRVEAGFYLVIYMVFFSLPLLWSIFFIEKIYFLNSFLFYFILIMPFLVKFPMFFFHLWLPRAHVEAPVYGSMILAGVMLKMGGYGIMKISLIWGDLVFKYSKVFIIFSLIGGIYMSFICFFQSDMKMLIAYSSVVHMSIIISSLLTLKELGLIGSFIMMIAHGFCSSGLFCLLGMTYSKTLTRSMYLNKGLINIMPVSTLWWFLFCSSNLSFPPSLNLVGEIFLLSVIFSWGFFLWIFILLMGIFSSLYSIYLFSYIQHGQNSFFFSFKNFVLKESLILFFHWIPLNLFILDLSFFYY